MSDNKREPHTITIDPELWRLSEAIAEKEIRSMSNFIEVALTEYLKTKDKVFKWKIEEEAKKKKLEDEYNRFQ